jgi:hypothetical protein
MLCGCSRGSSSASPTSQASPAQTHQRHRPARSVNRCFKPERRIALAKPGVVLLETGSVEGGVSGAAAGGDTWQYVLVPAGTYTIDATVDTGLADDLEPTNGVPGSELIVAALKSASTSASVKPVIFASERGLDRIHARCSP